MYRKMISKCYTFNGFYFPSTNFGEKYCDPKNFHFPFYLEINNFLNYGFMCVNMCVCEHNSIEF